MVNDEKIILFSYRKHLDNHGFWDPGIGYAIPYRRPAIDRTRFHFSGGSNEHRFQMLMTNMMWPKV